MNIFDRIDNLANQMNSYCGSMEGFISKLEDYNGKCLKNKKDIKKRASNIAENVDKFVQENKPNNDDDLDAVATP